MSARMHMYACAGQVYLRKTSKVHLEERLGFLFHGLVSDLLAEAAGGENARVRIKVRGRVRSVT